LSPKLGSPNGLKIELNAKLRSMGVALNFGGNTSTKEKIPPFKYQRVQNWTRWFKVELTCGLPKIGVSLLSNLTPPTFGDCS